MNADSKILSELNKQNDSLKTKLSEVEQKIGLQLLSGTEFHASEELAQQYAQFIAEKDSLQKNLEATELLEQNIAEKTKEIKALTLAIAGTKKREKEAYRKLGNYLYDNYTQVLAVAFGPSYAEAATLKNTISQLKNQQDTVEETMEHQNFLSRMVSQVKKQTLNTNIAMTSRKLDSLLESSAKSAFETDSISAETGGQPYEECVAIKNERASFLNNLSQLEAQKASLSEELKARDKKSSVNAKIADTAQSMTKVETAAGHDFVKNYITRDAEILTDFPADYADLFAQVLELKKELTQTNLRIDICNFEQDLKNIRKNIDSMNKETETNKENIARLNARNTALAAEILNAQAKYDEVLQKKADTEAELNQKNTEKAPESDSESTSAEN